MRKSFRGYGTYALDADKFRRRALAKRQGYGFLGPVSWALRV